MHDLLLDLRQTLRGFRRDAVYASAAVGTLALTLGACTAVFSIVNGVLLRPLPYPDPHQLVSIREIVPEWAKQYPTLAANLRHFEEWRTHATSFAAMAALDWRTTNVAGAGEPFQASVLRASGTLFDVLQTPVAIGRPLARTDEGPGAPPVIVISDALWRDRLGRDPKVLGRTLTLGGTPYTIVGVLPPRFDVPATAALRGAATLRSDFAAIMPFRVNVTQIGWTGIHNYAVVARLKPGITVEQAGAEIDVLQQSIAAIARRETDEATGLRGHVTALGDSIVGRSRSGLLLLLGAIVGVVLITCANLAHLAVTRTLGRLRDAAVRSALGASRSRLVHAVVLDQLVLAAAGGALGILVARAGLALFVTTAPIDLPRVADVVIDWRVLGFAGGIATMAALAIAVLPAWRLGRGDLQSPLRGGGLGATDRAGVRTRAVLLAVQVALSVTLLAVTGLFVTSFVRLLGVDPGFSAEQVVMVEIAPVATRYPDTNARATLYDRVVERARQLPGITALAWTSAVPLTGETWVDIIASVDDTRSNVEQANANYRFVGPDYFRTLSMPIVKGRSFEERDRARAVTPAVISARAARTLWPGADPIGKPFTRWDRNARFEVVGVVADGHPTSLEVESPFMVYVPYWYNNEGRSILVARTGGDAAMAIRDLRATVREVDPEVAIGDTMPLYAVVDRALEGRRHQASLLIAFGALALAIATIGVYATTAYGVSRRRREMNIRIALGAPIANVFTLILRQSALPLVVGVAAGSAGALAAGTLIAGLLFNVQPRDPLVMVTAAVLMTAAGVLAASTATHHGLRINPVEALRQE